MKFFSNISGNTHDISNIMTFLDSQGKIDLKQSLRMNSQLICSSFQIFQLPDRQLYNWVFSVSVSVSASVSPHFRLGPIFSQVFQWIATKLGMCIHLSMVLDEFKGIFDLTPFRGHFGLKTQKKQRFISWDQFSLRFLGGSLPNLACVFI